MANTYAYHGPGERWTEEQPTAEDFMNVARENIDHVWEALNNFMDTDYPNLGLLPDGDQAKIYLLNATSGFTASLYPFRINYTKTTGASDNADYFGSVYATFTLNQSGGVIGGVYGVYSQFQLTAGSVGDATTRSAYSFFGSMDINAGTITGNLYGVYLDLDLEAGATVGGNIIGIYLLMDDDAGAAGTVYGIYLNPATGIDYNIYAAGASTPSYFQGQVLLGNNASSVIGAGASSLQIHQSTAYCLAMGYWGNATTGPMISMGKSRSGTVGSYTIVQNDDSLGSIRWFADDGTDLVSESARIQALVDGTPGANDVPGRLAFFTTPDGSNSPSERMRISSTGAIMFQTQLEIVLGSTSGVTHCHTTNSAGMGFSYWGANNSGASLRLGKSRSATVGTATIVQLDDMLGEIRFYGDDGVDMANYGARIVAFCDGTPGSDDMPGRLSFQTTIDGQGSSTEWMRINSTGQTKLYQGGYDTAILTFENTDVTSGLTSATGETLTTNAYAYFKKVANSYGGLYIGAVAEDNASATSSLQLVGFGGTANTTKTGAGTALAMIDLYEHDAANALADITADGNVFAVRCRRGGSVTTVLIVDEDGDLYYDGSAAAFDSVDGEPLDDLSLVRAFDLAHADHGARGLVRTAWDRYVHHQEADLVALGILGAPLAEGGLVNATRLQQLHNGALWQLGVRANETDERIAHLERAAQARDLEIAELRRQLSLRGE
jgi:hypothetical protein